MKKNVWVACEWHCVFNGWQPGKLLQHTAKDDLVTVIDAGGVVFQMRRCEVRLPAVADDANSFLLASGGVWYPEWDIVRDGDQTFHSLEEYAKSEQ